MRIGSEHAVTRRGTNQKKRTGSMTTGLVSAVTLRGTKRKCRLDSVTMGLVHTVTLRGTNEKKRTRFSENGSCTCCAPQGHKSKQQA